MYKLLLTAVAALLLISSVSANEGSATIKLGYTAPDEMDHLGVNQETYNVYEGLGLSIQDLQYLTDFGILINGDFENITLNNRNLRLSVSKPGLFSLSGYHNKYRRTFDETGVYFTRRENSAINGTIHAGHNLKLFGGFFVSEKDGMTEQVYQPVIDTTTFKTNYTQFSYNMGLEGYCSYARVRGEYQRYEFEDDLNFSNDKKSDIYNASIYTSIPNYEQLTFAGGLINREDEVYDYENNLKTNTFWAASKYYFERNFTIGYRFFNSKAEQEQTATETTNRNHSLTLTKNWAGMGGFTLGYDFRTSDDETNKTKANGYIVSGWYKVSPKFDVKGRYSFIGKEVDEGSTTTGDLDRSRHMVSLRYKDNAWGSLEGKIEKRIKEYTEIESKADYTTFSSRLFLKNEDYGKLMFSYTYYLGKFENQSDNVSYEFADNVLCAALYPKAFGQLQFDISSTYFRSHRDENLEKFSTSLGATYSMKSGYQIQGSLSIYTFDDLMAYNRSYTANIFEINILKDIKF